ncbi:MAG: NUDIX hydrolase [Clostridia bacterium]|nr:NUDIX hydrolase [Clostridia bacterium]
MTNENDEAVFLASYDISKYERPSLTADVASFMIRSHTSGNYRLDSDKSLAVLLIRRANPPYRDCWALPGGFLEPGETVEQCAVRELREETDIDPVSIMPVRIFSTPGRDPRGWIISCLFASVMSEAEVRQKSGDDAADARWFDVCMTEDNGKCSLELTDGEITLAARLAERESRFGITVYDIEDGGTLAFDHAAMIASALSALRGSGSLDKVFDFLPGDFTLSQLQRVYEAVMNVSLQPANFRRKIQKYVEKTENHTQGKGHRPAMLYKRK